MAHIVPGASICLSPGIAVVEGNLVDLDGRRYELNMLGRIICSIAISPVDVGDLTTGIAEHYGKGIDETESDVIRFIIEMHHKGLFSIHQSFVAEWLASAARFLAGHYEGGHRARSVLGRQDYFFRRYPSTAGRAIRGVVEAYQVVAWMALIFIGAAICAEIATRPSAEVEFLGVRAILFWLSFYFLTMFVSVVLHELAHLLAARLTRSLTYSVYVSRGVVGISFKARSPLRTMCVVLAGPIAGIVSLLVSVSFVLYAPANFWVTSSFDQFRLPVIGAILCLVVWQLFAMTPLTVDGKGLNRALRQIRGATR